MIFTGLRLTFVILALALVIERQVVQGFVGTAKSSRYHHYYYPTTSTALGGSTANENGNQDNNNISASLVALEMSDTIEGTGGVAAFDSIVTIKYTGSLLSFESESQQEPVPFDQSMISFKIGYGKVLDGCDRGIRGMKVGGIRVLKIPSHLGFGTEGFEGAYSIPPNSDLQYTVELIAVTSGPMAEAAANMGIGLDRNTVYLK
mmetsp:Transcript_6412/g.7371  ORF Transcript_6412/g.7371 Transcript_6412/m.7371 type:complete len:204 (-) Transcript_6412:239-850(-)|eukprot:CAMPEP_0170796792 /NCGR_PEP_ID=MMETSP0733-20121128/25126_1 /TAXON_ID=186038 /ORGANISM="Fragilariopsis kerguelensis, Strain L26-C5" /LENGTH=203 /DNA_ID=CAMNT_0011147331 /DNA_START=74 /DNA_END=685 /DNA_ORIENTATION=-